MKALTAHRVKVIKAAWKPGMTIKDIAAAIDDKVWGGKPSRGAIVGMFNRWPMELAPCHLEPVRKSSKPKSEPKPKIDKRTLPIGTTAKNTKLIGKGYIAPDIAKAKRVQPPIRASYELDDKAMRKHLHEERMLARDRANVSSPAYRFNTRK